MVLKQLSKKMASFTTQPPASSHNTFRQPADLPRTCAKGPMLSASHMQRAWSVLRVMSCFLWCGIALQHDIRATVLSSVQPFPKIYTHGPTLPAWLISSRDWRR
jgi:hypothetical protein